MNIVISLLAIFGLTFFIRDSDGPWGVMAWLRNKLMNNPFAGVFFFNLLGCPFCTGCHSGWIIYLLTMKQFEWQLFMIWIFAGGAISLILETILGRLHRE